MTRFAKKNKGSQDKQPHYKQCIAHDCPLPPYRANADGVRVSCLYHRLDDSEQVRDTKTRTINEHIGLIRHYINVLRTKTPVELMLTDQDPGIVQSSETSRWNRKAGESWQSYKQRFGQMLNKMIKSAA